MASVLCLFSIVMWAFVGVTLTQAEKVMRPKFNDIKLWSDEKHVTHAIVMDANDPHVNLTLNVLQELLGLDTHIEARLQQKLDPSYVTNFDTTINFCSRLNWYAKSRLGALIGAYLKQYGKLLEKCPIVKGQYYLHKIWIPEDTTWAKLPELLFSVNFSAYHIDAAKQRTLILNDHFSGELLVQDVNNVKPGIFSMLPKDLVKWVPKAL